MKITDFINPSGDKVYRVSGTLGERRIRENHSTLADAEAALANYIAPKEAPSEAVVTSLSEKLIRKCEMASWEFDLEEILRRGLEALREAPKAKDLAPLAETFITEVEAASSKGWAAQIRNQLRVFIKDHPGASTISIKRADIAKFLGAIPNPVTRRHYRSVITRFYGWLIEHGHTEISPATDLLIRKGYTDADDVVPAILTLRQVEALMATTRAPEGRRLKGWLALSIFAGLRPSEAERLEWGQVNFESNSITLMGRKRGSQARIVTMRKHAAKWLQEVKQDGEASPGFYSLEMRRNVVVEANKGLPEADRIKWDHDILRHTFASYSAAEGVSLHDLAAQMGNSPNVIHRHYRAPVSKADAVAFWGESKRRLLHKKPLPTLPTRHRHKKMSVDVGNTKINDLQK